MLPILFVRKNCLAILPSASEKDALYGQPLFYIVLRFDLWVKNWVARIAIAMMLRF